MGIVELFLIAVGLSMDAFAVAVCKGLAMKKCTWTKAGIVGLYFGVFQAGMPLIGYVLGVQFKDFITSIDTGLRSSFLGLSDLIWCESQGKRNARRRAKLGCEDDDRACGCDELDALAVGVTFAFLQVKIVPAVSFIGVTTFIISVAGVKIGNIFGAKYKSKAELAGGIILILMGVKILLEHLGFLG